MSTTGVFLARSDELGRFAEALTDTQSGAAGQGWPVVVLVHGVGGIGKSSVLRRFRESTEPLDAVAWIDFEEARRLQPAAFGGDNGPGLQTVFDLLMRKCLEAFEDHGDRGHAEKAFDRYRANVVKLPGLLDQMRSALADASERGVSKDAIVAAEKSAVALAALVAHQPVAFPAAAGAASALGQAALSRPGLWKRLRGAAEVDAGDYELASEPHQTLARAFGEGMRKVSELRPLVVFLDTSEVILSQMPWVREAMRTSGDRVLWAVAARLEPESAADPESEVAAFVRQVPDDRLRLMALTRFDDETVREYVEHRIAGRRFDDDDINMLAGFTRGLPLAVSLVGDLLERGESLARACEAIKRPNDALAPLTAGEVVSALARRFLVHTEKLTSETAQRDLHRILCMAIANGAPTRNPDILRALWDTQDDLFDALQDLARLHDFVLSGTFRLHDDVRDALRADLCDSIRRTRVEESCRRAVRVVEAELDRQRRLLPTLEQQLNSEAYLALLYDLVWYGFWARPEEGWTSAVSERGHGQTETTR